MSPRRLNPGYEAAVDKFLKAGYRTFDLQASPEHKVVGTEEAGDLIAGLI